MGRLTEIPPWAIAIAIITLAGLVVFFAVSQTAIKDFLISQLNIEWITR